MDQLKETSVMDKQSQLIDKLMRQKQALLNGYTGLITILDTPGDVSKSELMTLISETLSKHNEV
jgi:hypothetical protein